jgi:hypothetical protein
MILLSGIRVKRLSEEKALDAWNVPGYRRCTRHSRRSVTSYPIYEKGDVFSANGEAGSVVICLSSVEDHTKEAHLHCSIASVTFLTSLHDLCIFRHGFLANNILLHSHPCPRGLFSTTGHAGSVSSLRNAGSFADLWFLRQFRNAVRYRSLEDAERTQPFDSIASGLIEQYADLTQEFTDYRLPWTFERSCAVSLDTCGIISVRFEESSFLGGAHGLHIVRLASFDASSGRRLTYADMFRSGYESAFAGIAEKEFRLARSVPDSQSLSAAGFWVEEGKFEPSGNFCVGKEGLVLYYNPYEIAPYVMGPTEVHVSYTSLKGILRSGRPPGNF